MSVGELGPLLHVGSVYGKSVQGLPLRIFQPSSNPIRTLLMASMHGDESMGTVLLSECLRQLKAEDFWAAVIPAVNPDGVLAGTRCNGRGVDLNRNYPTTSWKSDLVYFRNNPNDPTSVALSPGVSAASEPETQALIDLVHKIKPQLIVSVHGFLGCIDDPSASSISKDIAQRTGMELVPDVDYATPGSFGSWCLEQSIPIITYELPQLSLAEMREIHNPVFMDLMTGFYEH